MTAMTTKTFTRPTLLTAMAATAAVALPMPAVARAAGGTARPAGPPADASAHPTAPTAVLPASLRLRAIRTDDGVSLAL
jgi:hypothetical protein